MKIAERLIRSAVRAGSDPRLALLDYSNSLTESLGSRPSQRLFSRRTKTYVQRHMYCFFNLPWLKDLKTAWLAPKKKKKSGHDLAVLQKYYTRTKLLQGGQKWKKMLFYPQVLRSQTCRWTSYAEIVVMYVEYKKCHEYKKCQLPQR